ncbi:sensor domain-containing diguanylate cyclase [Marinomonas posidonica]|uniref:diguanylate cyclase n=1 Tax=Marinomonas posidonica (strain CECT 7376 / NCIMB 14433 / IVIA-Po-181) TaxID=491952 RepID=F6CWD2_MARPP|nr:GGDEF domain-containing protein [Marinomonas posidonica]AEF53187.1 diguanylate cyclase [Marinomonas posidonica IVIA-Po-181]
MTRKQKTLDVLFNDPSITAALARVNVFVINHYSGGRDVISSLIPDADFAAQVSYDPLMWLDYVHPDDRDVTRQAWNDIVEGISDVFEGEYRFLVDGEYRWIANKGTVITRAEDGMPELYIGADRDITAERQLCDLLEGEKERLTQLVIRDDFLNIPNRRYLETKQSQFFIADGRTPMAVLVLDIDNFKQLNTDLTHHGCDKVLQTFVRHISTCLQPMDILARYGGDEFVLILPNATLDDAQAKAQCILDVVSHIDLSSMKDDLFVSVSIGLVHGLPKVTEDFWTYFEEADAQLLLAKKLGKAQIQSKVLG